GSANPASHVCVCDRCGLVVGLITEAPAQTDATTTLLRSVSGGASSVAWGVALASSLRPPPRRPGEYLDTDHSRPASAPWSVTAPPCLSKCVRRERSQPAGVSDGWRYSGSSD